MKKKYIALIGILATEPTNAGVTTIQGTTTDQAFANFTIKMESDRTGDYYIFGCVNSYKREPGGGYTVAAKHVTVEGDGYYTTVPGPRLYKNKEKTTLHGTILCSNDTHPEYKYVRPYVHQGRTGQKWDMTWTGEMSGHDTTSATLTDLHELQTVSRSLTLHYADNATLQKGETASMLWVPDGNAYAHIEITSDLGDKISCADNEGVITESTKIGKGSLIQCTNRMEERTTTLGYLRIEVTMQ